MARTVRLATIQGVPFVPEDGSVGILVGLHWTVRVRFVLLYGGLLGVTGWAGARLWSDGILPHHPATVLALAAILGTIGAFAILDYRELRDQFLLFTRANVYYSRIEKLVRKIVDVTPIQRVTQSQRLEGIGLTNSRTLIVNIEGDHPDITFRHSDIGKRGIAHIHALTAEAT